MWTIYEQTVTPGLVTHLARSVTRLPGQAACHLAPLTLGLRPLHRAGDLRLASLVPALVGGLYARCGVQGRLSFIATLGRCCTTVSNCLDRR